MKNFRQIVLAVLLVAIAFAPVITSLMSWSLDWKLSDFKYQIRHHSYPTLVLEVGVVLFALADGLSLAVCLRNLLQWQRWMLGLVVASAVLSILLVAPEPALAWQATIEWAVHFVFAASIGFLLARHQGHLIGAWFWSAFVVGTLCYVGLVIVFVPAVPNPGSFPWHLRMPGFTNVRHLGYFIAPAIAALIAWCMTGKRGAATVFSKMALWVLVCFGCWTGSRGSAFALAISVLAAVLLYPAFRRLRPWFIVSMVVVSAVLASAALPRPSPSFGLLARFTQASSAEAPEFTSGRLDVWKKTVRAIADQPWIGHGAGQYRTIMAGKIGQPFNHPHNFILQVLFQWGLFGAIGFFSLLASVSVVAFRNARSRGPEAAPSFMVLTSLLAFSLLDGTGNYPLPLVLMLIAGADLLKSARPEAGGAE